MRLVELRLLAFGPFTGLSLDLSAAPGLHLVYGPNEAGKSTTLRAIGGLLYGIPANTLDAHLHRMPDLRVGARLSDGNGTVLDLVRRKGNKNTLLDADGNPVDEAILHQLLGGVGESLFRTMFGLDHESLRAGGEALLRGQGDVGESLFDAGVGGPGIHRVLEDLRREADGIFRPQGHTQRLNQAITAYRDADKRSRESAVSAEAWFAQREEIEAARREREGLQQERRRASAEQARLQRALRVLPLLARRRARLAEREAVGDVVGLAADAAAQRSAAQRDAEASDLQKRRVEEAIAALGLKRDGLDVAAGLRQLDDAAVEDLQRRLGAHRAAAGDLPRRRAELQALGNDMRTLLRELGRETPLEELESLRLPAAVQSRLRNLAKRQGALERDLEHTAAALAERRARLQVQTSRLRGDGAPAAGERQSAHGSLPSLATVDRFAAELDGLEREEADLRGREREVHSRASKAAGAIAELKLLGDVPTEEQLLAARGAREALWADLLAALERPLEARGVATAYEASVRRADETADRLRREAERTGKLAKLVADRHENEEELGWLATQREALARRRGEHINAWRSLWEPFGAEARAPAEMRAWLEQRHQLRESTAELEREVATLAENHRQAERHLADWRTQWQTGVAAIGLDQDASAEEAEAVLEKLAALLVKVDEAGRLRSRVAAMERDAEILRADVQALTSAHAPELAALPLEEAAEQLIRRQREAREKEKRRRELDEEIEAQQQELAHLGERNRRAEDTLSLLQRAAGVSSVAALEEAERRSADAHRLDGELRQVEAEILDAGDGARADELDELTRGLDPDSARARLPEIEAAIEETNDEISRLDRKIAGAEIGLADFDSRRAAVDAAAEAQEHAAAIHTHVQRYLRARLAVVILEQEIERYRQQNQGPILQRANELFPRLTLDSYQALKVGFDERDEGVLLCIRPDGTEVAVEGLSDGARDQLYLALRLASLERYLQHNPAMPVILDDILIHFDDDRSRAALAVLGEFAAKAQVLFFTHHARLVELAREAVPDLVEHRL